MKVILPKRLFTPAKSSITSLLTADLAELTQDFKQQPTRVENYPLFTNMRQAKHYLNRISLTEQGEVISNIFYFIEIDNADLVSTTNRGKSAPDCAINLPLQNSSKAKVNIEYCIVNAVQSSEQQYAIEVSIFSVDKNGVFKRLDAVTEHQDQLPENARRHGRRDSYQFLESKMQPVTEAYSLAIPTAKPQNISSKIQLDKVAEFMQACNCYFAGWISTDVQRGYDVYKNLYDEIAKMADSLSKKDLYRIAQYHKYIKDKNLFWLQKASDKGHVAAKIDLIGVYYFLSKQGDNNAADKANELCQEVLQNYSKKLKSEQKKLVENYQQLLNPDSIQYLADTSAQQTTGTSSQGTASFDNQTMVIHDTLSTAKEPSPNSLHTKRQAILQQAQLSSKNTSSNSIINKKDRERQIPIKELISSSNKEQLPNDMLQQAQYLANNKLPCPLLMTCDKVDKKQRIPVAELMAIINYAKAAISHYQNSRSGYSQSFITKLFRDPVLEQKRHDLAVKLMQEIDDLIASTQSSNGTDVSLKPLLLHIDKAMIDNQTYSLEHKQDATQSRTSGLYNTLLNIGIKIIANQPKLTLFDQETSQDSSQNLLI
jgi:hypothetical protein